MIQPMHARETQPVIHACSSMKKALFDAQVSVLTTLMFYSVGPEKTKVISPPSI